MPRPIADDEVLRERVARAWGVRNRLAHRSFLENLPALFDPSRSERLVKELSGAVELSQDAAALLVGRGYALANERGVEAEDLELFGSIARLLMMRDPQLFESLDLWDRTAARISCVSRLGGNLGCRLDD
jgi:hypothetical protein